MGLSIPLLASSTHASINVLRKSADAQAMHAAWAADSFTELLGWCNCAEHACNLAYCTVAEMQHACLLLKLRGLTEKKLSKN